MNEIDVAISGKAFSLVLRYVALCVFCAMRLTKRNNEPVIRFEFNFLDTGNCLVVHDLPIEVLRPEFAWSEPTLPDPDSRLVLTQPMRKLSLFIERLRQMGVPEIAVTISHSETFADIRLSGVSDSIRTSVRVHKQPHLPPTTELGDFPDVVQITVTLSGFSFILSRLSSVDQMSRCLIMVSEEKYLSVLSQLPNQLGCVACITPAIIP